MNENMLVGTITPCACVDVVVIKHCDYLYELNFNINYVRDHICKPTKRKEIYLIIDKY